MKRKEQAVCGNKQWIDISAPDAAGMQSLSEQFRLNPHIVADCMQPEHLPKYDLVDGVNFLIIRFYAVARGQKASTIQDLTDKIAIFYTSDFLLTIHKAEVPYIEDLYQKRFPGGCSSIDEIVARLIWECLETYDEPAEYLSDRIDVHESRVILRNADHGQMEALYHIKRRASLAHKVLMLMQEPIAHLRMASKDDPALQDVKDQHLKMLTLYTQIMDDANNLMNLYMSFSEQRSNEVMKVLTIFSAFFLPLTFIAGIYGMNFHFMPELSKPWGYPAALGLMLVVTIGIFIWFKRKKWM